MPSQFAKYQPYVRGLVRMANEHALLDRYQWQKELIIALNGQAGDQLQARVPVETRRKHGTFFTGHKLAEKLVKRYKGQDLKNTIWLDPTVGGADLHIAVARLLGKGRTCDETIERWGDHLLGMDLQPEFIQASKARLVLLARSLHEQFEVDPVEWSEVFTNIRKGNALTELEIYERATHLVMNPPFAKMNAPDECSWGDGKVNAAAVFMETAVKHARSGAVIHAILPEVLRTGTRYEKWQHEITKHADLISARPQGLFHNADVDVFNLTLKKKVKSVAISRSFSPRKRKKAHRLGDLFKVSVGAVVPYRDPKRGPRYRYLHPKNAEAWDTLIRADAWRRFSGTVFKPPFVVIRRTSRPGDAHRATASIVLGNRSVAVENHLIVCQPNNGQIESCEKLMHALRSSIVDAFLDKEMRCRHLTVGVVKSLPIAQ